jgi:hypothetical protein
MERLSLTYCVFRIAIYECHKGIYKMRKPSFSIYLFHYENLATLAVIQTIRCRILRLLKTGVIGHTKIL